MICSDLKIIDKLLLEIHFMRNWSMHQSRQKLRKVGFRYVQKIQVKFVDTKLNSLTKMGKINENKAQVGQNFEN